MVKLIYRFTPILLVLKITNINIKGYKYINNDYEVENIYEIRDDME